MRRFVGKSIFLISLFGWFLLANAQTPEDAPVSVNAPTQTRQLKVCFWNVENLFDPADDPEKEDDEYTPEGARHWTSYRQYEKFVNLTRGLVAIGEGQPPAIIGLAEVENDSCLHRWTHRTPMWRWDYDYLITHSKDVRGINVALLYQPMDFRLLGWESISIPMPEEMRPTRDLLHAWGRLVSGDTLDVIVCHLPSRRGGAQQTQPGRKSAHDTMLRTMDSIQHVRVQPHLIVMGDMNDYPTTKEFRQDFKGYVDLMLPLQKRLAKHPNEIGSHKYDGEWGFLDHFLTTKVMTDTLGQSVSVANAHVMALPFMLTDDNSHLGQRPKRSYYGYKYEGGYSDHLPIVLDLKVKF